MRPKRSYAELIHEMTHRWESFHREVVENMPSDWLETVEVTVTRDGILLRPKVANSVKDTFR